MTDGAAPAQAIRHLHGEGGACRRCLLWSGRTSRWGLSQPPIFWLWSSQQNVTIPTSAEGRAQPWRFLESIDENIQTQVTEEPVGRDALLDLTLIKKGRLPEDVRVKGCLDHSDQEMVKLSILRGDSRAKTRIPTRAFRREDFDFFWDSLRRVPWDKSLKGRKVQESWLIFNNHLPYD